MRLSAPMNPPTKDQLCRIPEDLDGQCVVSHLLGKDVREAAALLEQNSAHYSDDYLWMGPEAFCYYCPALILYLRSDVAVGDRLFAYGMLDTFRHLLDREGARIAPAFSTIKEFCSMVEGQPERFGLDENYARRAGRCVAEVRSRLAALSGK